MYLTQCLAQGLCSVSIAVIVSSCSLLNTPESCLDDVCGLYSPINDAFPRILPPWDLEPCLSLFYTPAPGPVLAWDGYSGGTRWLSTFSSGSTSCSVPMGPWPCLPADRLAILMQSLSSKTRSQRSMVLSTGQLAEWVALSIVANAPDESLWDWGCWVPIPELPAVRDEPDLSSPMSCCLGQVWEARGQSVAL